MPGLRRQGGDRGVVGEGVLNAPTGTMPDSALCEAVPLETIAEAVGTPAYVYSATSMRDQFRALARALDPIPYRIHYSVKANANFAVLTLLRELGAGVDIVSGGELFRSLRAGFEGPDIVFSGVGKAEHELRDALGARVLLVNVESEGELLLLDRVAGEMGLVAPVALRINPEVSVVTPHHYTRTGERGNKFGIPYEDALRVARTALALPHTRLLGLDMHVGSQVAQLDPYRQGMQRLLGLCALLRADGGAPDLRYLDIGGGLAVTYETELPTEASDFAAAVIPLMRGTGLTLLVEPGRFFVGNAGLLLTRVLYRKHSGGRDYVITDAGMNDLLRPSHYNAYHRIDAVRGGPEGGSYDIVGPVCESGDFFALGRPLPDMQPDDLLVIRSAGAYGFAMASNYNSRPRAAEVMVDGRRFAVITERESYADLVRHEPTTLAWRES